MNDVGEPCAGERHARFDRGPLARRPSTARWKACTRRETRGTEPTRPTGGRVTSGLPHRSVMGEPPGAAKSRGMGRATARWGSPLATPTGRCGEIGTFGGFAAPTGRPRRKRGASGNRYRPGYARLVTVPGSGELRHQGAQGGERSQEALGPGPVLGQVQGGAPGRTRQVPGHTDVASAQGGQGDRASPAGYPSQSGAPAGQVMGDGPERQPGRVGPKTPRGHMGGRGGTERELARWRQGRVSAGSTCLTREPCAAQLAASCPPMSTEGGVAQKAEGSL